MVEKSGIKINNPQIDYTWSENEYKKATLSRKCVCMALAHFLFIHATATFNFQIVRT
jgi:hypothetical protein